MVYNRVVRTAYTTYVWSSRTQRSPRSVILTQRSKSEITNRDKQKNVRKELWRAYNNRLLNLVLYNYPYSDFQLLNTFALFVIWLLSIELYIDLGMNTEQSVPDSRVDFTAQILWHMDNCQLSAINSSVLATVLKSIINLTRSYGYANTILEGHYTLENYCVRSSEQWELLYLYNVKTYRYSLTDVSRRCSRDVIWEIVWQTITTCHFQPLFLITGDAELLEHVVALLNQMAIDPAWLVICTSLPDDVCVNFVKWGAAVYRWTSSQGVIEARMTLDEETWDMLSPEDLNLVAPLLKELEESGVL